MARVGIIFGTAAMWANDRRLDWNNRQESDSIHSNDDWNSDTVLRCRCMNPHRRKHAMRFAGILALFGTSVGAIRSLVWLSRWMRDGAGTTLRSDLQCRLDERSAERS